MWLKIEKIISLSWKSVSFCSSKYTKFFEEYDLLDIPGLDEANNTDYAEKIIDCLKDMI